MKNRNSLSILFFSFIMLGLFVEADAQKNKTSAIKNNANSKRTTQVLLLKDGSKVRGKLLQFFPDSLVLFQMENGSKVSFSSSEVKRIDFGGKAIISGKSWPSPVRAEFNYGVTANEGSFGDPRSISQVAVAVLYDFTHYFRAGLGHTRYRISEEVKIRPVYAQIEGAFYEARRAELEWFLMSGVTFTGNGAEDLERPNSQHKSVANKGWYLQYGIGLEVKLKYGTLLFRISQAQSKLQIETKAYDGQARPSSRSIQDRVFRSVNATIGFRL